MWIFPLPELFKTYLGVSVPTREATASNFPSKIERTDDHLSSFLCSWTSIASWTSLRARVPVSSRDPSGKLSTLSGLVALKWLTNSFLASVRPSPTAASRAHLRLCSRGASCMYILGPRRCPSGKRSGCSKSPCFRQMHSTRHSGHVPSDVLGHTKLEAEPLEDGRHPHISGESSRRSWAQRPQGHCLLKERIVRAHPSDARETTGRRPRPRSAYSKLNQFPEGQNRAGRRASAAVRAHLA